MIKDWYIERAEASLTKTSFFIFRSSPPRCLLLLLPPHQSGLTLLSHAKQMTRTSLISFNILPLEDISYSQASHKRAAMKKDEKASACISRKKKRPTEALKEEERGGGGSDGGKAPPVKRTKEVKPEVEKRPFTTRKSSGPFRDRLYRAATQRMFLIHHEDRSTEGNLCRRFHVAGTTGKTESGLGRGERGLVGMHLQVHMPHFSI